MTDAEWNHITLLVEQLRAELQYNEDSPTTRGVIIGYIHRFVVDQGKNLLMKGYRISEIAFRLGFEYPHHFTRIFRKVSGMTPREFISSE